MLARTLATCSHERKHSQQTVHAWPPNSGVLLSLVSYYKHVECVCATALLPGSSALQLLPPAAAAPVCFTCRLMGGRGGAPVGLQTCKEWESRHVTGRVTTQSAVWCLRYIAADAQMHCVLPLAEPLLDPCTPRQPNAVVSEEGVPLKETGQLWLAVHQGWPHWPSLAGHAASNSLVTAA